MAELKTLDLSHNEEWWKSTTTVDILKAFIPQLHQLTELDLTGGNMLLYLRVEQVAKNLIDFS